MVGEIRRGKAAIQEATEAAAKGGGNFKPFIPQIFWSKDKEERYLLFLTPVDEAPQFDMITWIENEGPVPEMAVAKTDPYFGEKSDAFVETWDAKPKVTDLAIAVELEPIVEIVNGRKKPKGFEVLTKEFSRRILDDEGELTEETEEVTTPVVGLIAQSPANFFSVLKQIDDTDFPVHETPIKITRIGKDSNTSYGIMGYDGQEVDLSNLFEYLSGVTYLGEDLDPLVEEIDGVEPQDAAYKIGTVLLDKKMEELLDPERYDELFAGVTETMDKWGNKKGKGKSERRAPARAARPSQRRSAKEDAEPAAEEAPAVTSASDPDDKMAALEARAAAKAAAKK